MNLISTIQSAHSDNGFSAPLFENVLYSVQFGDVGGQFFRSAVYIRMFGIIVGLAFERVYTSLTVEREFNS